MWPPRAHPDPFRFQSQQPIVLAFEQRVTYESNRAYGTRDVRWLDKWLDALVSELKVDRERSGWEELASSFLLFCTGIALPMDHTLPFFVRTLWAQIYGTEKAALDILLDAQKCSDQLNQTIMYPRVNLTNLDHFESYDDSNDENANVANDLCYSGINALTLTARNKPLWLSGLQSNLALFTTKWTKDLNTLFYQDLQAHELDCAHFLGVEALREMRAVPRSLYDTEIFRRHIVAVGLVIALLRISQPGAATHRGARYHLSDRHHRWQYSLGEIIQSWTPADLTLSIAQSLEKRETFRDGSDTYPHALEFLRVLDTRPHWVPGLFEPQGVYFLLSRVNFVAEWYNNLLPLFASDDLFKGQAHDWSPYQIYRSIMNVTESQATSALTDPRLLTIFKRSKQLVAKHKSVRSIAGGLSKPLVTQHKPRNSGHKTAHRSVKTNLLPVKTPKKPSLSSTFTDKDGLLVCKTCAKQSENDRCIRQVIVEEHPEPHTLEGVVLTFAPIDDLPLPQHGHSDNQLPLVVYKSPTDLGMRPIQHRPYLFHEGRCGRDITYLIDKRTNKLVGGVRFLGIENRDLMLLKTHHAQAIRAAPSVKRGGSHASWADGLMIPFGTRAAQGGRPGDAFTSYSYMLAETPDQIQIMFNHAEDADILDNVVLSSCPSVIREVRKETESAGLCPVGTGGGNLYYCDAYRTAQHIDHDESWSLCCQLEKKVDDIRNYSFAYSLWGVYIETQSRAAWWFKSNHHHGTIMPSNSALASPSCSVLNNSGLGPPSDALINTDSAPGFHTTHGNLARPVVISTGIHKTTRKKDASRAAQYRNVRAAQAAVGNYWRSQGVEI